MDMEVGVDLHAPGMDVSILNPSGRTDIIRVDHTISVTKEDRFEGSMVPEASIVVAIMAVSFSAILIRWSEAHPLSIALYRMLFTLVLLTPFALTTMKEDLRKNPISTKEAGQIFMIGIVLSFHFALWITSLTMTTVASSVLLVTFHPVFVGVVGYHMLGERLGKVNILGMAIAMIGAFVIVYGDFAPMKGDPFSQKVILGDILAFLGGLAAGTYILAGRHFRKKMSLITYVFILYYGCTVSLLIMCLIAGADFHYPPKEFLLFLLMALGPGILGHTFYNWSLRYVKATVVSVSLLGEPIGSSLLAYLLLFEVPSNITLIGGVAILMGIYLTASGLKGIE